MPRHCRPSAYSLFEEHVRRLDRPGALLGAATAVSLHEMPDVDPDEVVERVGALAASVRAGTLSDEPSALLAHLHRVLFDEEDFRGNAENYHDPRNSYVPWVLESRRGLPITLTLVYRCVAEQVGLVVRGLNLPGHFLALVEGDGAPMIVDPFVGGRVLTREEAFARIEQVTGLSVLRDDRPFPEATPRQWLRRILQNLIVVLRAQGREDDARAMLEMQALVD
jgi:regulator of sirC expression with transglutaminase-like and TPR domain